MRAAIREETFPQDETSSCDKYLFLLIPTLCICALYFRNDGTEFGGSIYQKVNSNLETAVHLAWTAGSNNTRFGIGAKYQLDKDASLSVRTDLKSLFKMIKPSEVIIPA